MTLYFITGSKNKLAEVKAVLPDVEQLEIDLPEIQELDAHKIIQAKLVEARHHAPKEYIVEDTSLYFDGMNGLPGPLNKWFLNAIGFEGLYKLAQTFGNAAEAKTIIGHSDEEGKINFFEGSTRGTIVAPQGESNFGWDSIFLPEGHDKTYAQMSLQEKDSISHRGKALRKLVTFLKK
jgi:inosine triphosphate pyrophosphatase